MKFFRDPDSLSAKVGNYTITRANELLDSTILQNTRMRRRQLGRMMRAYDRDHAKARLPKADYFISRKIDGEFTCLVYRDGEVLTINPGGTIRFGAPFHDEARRLLDAAGIKSAFLGGELYVRRDDDQRPRVHDVVRVARAPENEEQVASLCFGVFNVYELDGVDLSMRYGEAITRAQELFKEGDQVHPVETVTGDFDKVFERFDEWVLKEDAEGVVVRSDQAGVFKIKPRHTLDLAVVGFSAGIDDRSGMLHSLLLAVVRPSGTFQIVSRVGGGFTDEQRISLLQKLTPLGVDSEYAEVNSDRVAYQMLKPGLVAEISCLDIISRTSHGSSIDRMVIQWQEQENRWEGVRRLPLASIISPQFLRIRDDKNASADDVKLSQLSDIREIPQVDKAAADLKLPVSIILRRTVATKQLKGATMVRKLLLWKTNKQEVSRDFPSYVLHITDYSPNRKDPLSHEIVVSDSEKQIERLFEQTCEEKFVRGWKVIRDSRPESG